jgi:hypothetical protein
VGTSKKEYEAYLKSKSPMATSNKHISTGNVDELYESALLLKPRLPEYNMATYKYILLVIA